MKLKLFLIFIFLIVLGLLAYFAYPVVKSRYFNNEDKEEESVNVTDNDQEQDQEAGETATDVSGNENLNNDGNESDAAGSVIPIDEINESGDVSNITAEDCDSECRNFEKDEKNLKYCQEVCGLSDNQNADNCDQKQGIDKDSCLKNQAVINKDFKICDNIQDANIKSSCKNRVTEELIENN
jgi:hypothetical protein